MTAEQKYAPTWILIVSGIFAAMELIVSITMCVLPETVADNMDLTAKGVSFLINVWASRQFALGFIFAYATIKKSIPMLTLAYIFLLVMFMGDFLIGLSQNDTPLLVSSVVMAAISAAMIVALHKNR